MKQKKIENCHQLIHIQINLDSKFRPQQTILIFETHFLKKLYILLKTEKNRHNY